MVMSVDSVSFFMSLFSVYVATVATIVPILMKHENRLTRLEGKIDTVLELLNNEDK